MVVVLVPMGRYKPPNMADDEVRMVECVKFGKPMEGLPKAPLKGEIGLKIYENISKEAWQMWLEHSKMLINEFRLDLLSESGQRIWMDELDKYFWGEGSQLPPDFKPQQAK
jgi:Fe-S cluster biosynthesis and repair protein YggX